MKDLCGTRVCPDDEGYYVLQMSDWALKDPNAAMQARWLNLSYTTKVWDDSQAASEFGRGVLHPMLVKDLYTLPSEILMAQAAKQIALGHHYHMALLDRVHEAGRLVTLMGNRASHLEAEVAKLKLEGDPEQLTAKELNEFREGLAKSQRQVREQKVHHRKADDELLRLLRENETLKTELPSKSIANNKQSVGFKWGLQRMRQVFYEYGYWVALARFHDRYPDLEVDNDPFTEKPEDNLVPMETRQEFDVSIPPEE
ncbi:hypothetical protein B296_00009415 [Ensete ventricosum]|uniref:Uncharacterized protein n=1 Tax=Ensete ventricosum TaxID=4639 RepID=A0A427AVX1_ENSVE|nr:hypothetical protein B296_00009415 [Ensete ventricosum]